MCCEKEDNKKELKERFERNRKKLDKEVDNGNQTICDIFKRILTGNEFNLISSGHKNISAYED